jgi:hypothetical protein
MDDGFRKPRMSNPKLRWIFPTVLVFVVLSVSYIMIANSIEKNQQYNVGKLASPATKKGECDAESSFAACKGIIGKACSDDVDCMTDGCRGNCMIE